MDVTFEELTETTVKKIKFSFLVTLICFSLLYLLFPIPSYVAVMIALSIGLTLLIFTFITLREGKNLFEKIVSYIFLLILVGMIFYGSFRFVRNNFEVGTIFAGIVSATVFFGIIYNVVYFFGKIVPDKKIRYVFLLIFSALITFFYIQSYVIDEFLISFNELKKGEESLISRIGTSGTVLSAALFFLHNMQLKLISQKEKGKTEIDSETETVTEIDSKEK